ncbi:MAG: glycerol-3-phosphate dehydrogenase, partial [Burkholderiaceae bacterium]|nr:glycerol-3-phosphate dehydrogenase [Burkholderiaceae bacterium]
MLGAGAWGTALSIQLARRPAAAGVWLWARDPDQALSCASSRENARYLPGHRLPPGLQVTGDLKAALVGWD